MGLSNLPKIGAFLDCQCFCFCSVLKGYNFIYKTIVIKGFEGVFMIIKCYNKTYNKALRDGNLKGLLTKLTTKELAMAVSNNTRNIERGQFNVFIENPKKKSIKDTLTIKRTLQGVGYNSKGEYKAMDGDVMTPAYKKWRYMLVRCYNEKCHLKQPQYIGCSVSSEWHDFQNFADWYYKNKYSGLGYQLDKDLLISNNKAYSPDTCCLIPQELNKLLTDHGSNRGVYPQGVNLHKPSGKYRSQIRIRGRKVFLGCYLCPQEAHQAYVVAKEAYVKEVANEWRGRIDERVYEALMNWKLNN